MNKVLKHPLFIIFGVYALYILVLWPFGEFAINDDWVFKLQVMAFEKGVWGIHTSVDPSFILHAFLGLAWAKVFGLTFVSLRILTLVQGFIALVGVYKIFDLYKKDRNTQLFFLLLVFANPLFLISIPTFMTEISFLMFTIWAIYFLLKHRTTLNYWDLLMGSIFIGCSILIRQTGIVTYLAFMLTSAKFSKKKLLSILFSSLVVGGFILVYILWPRFHISGQLESGLSDTFSKIAQLQQLPRKIRLSGFFFSYIGYFLLPFSVMYIRFLSKRHKFLVFLIAFIVSLYIFSIDVFATGNVYYLEGLHIKAVYSSNFSLFDNLSFKYLVAFLNSISLGVFIFWLKDKIKSSEVFLGLNFLGYFCINYFGNDLYERYYLPAAIILIIIIGVSTTKVHFSSGVLASFAFLVIISLFLQIDYFSQTRLRWEQAQKISEQTGLVNQIYVDGTYKKYVRALKMDDLTGVRSSKAGGYEHTCFVQKYTLNTNAPVLSYLQGIDDYLKKYVDNPRVYEGRKPQGLPKAKNNLDKLIFNDEYASPLYNLVGKKAFVGSWCLDESDK